MIYECGMYSNSLIVVEKNELRRRDARAGFCSKLNALKKCTFAKYCKRQFSNNLIINLLEHSKSKLLGDLVEV